MVGDLDDPVVVERARQQEWLVEGPGGPIPSHGTDLLGQRYAHDLVRTDHRPGRTRDATAEQPVHATFDGVIVQAWTRPAPVALCGPALGTAGGHPHRPRGVRAPARGRQALLVGAIGAGIVVRAPKGRDPVHGVRWSAA